MFMNPIAATADAKSVFFIYECSIFIYKEMINFASCFLLRPIR
ncbi:hypothetical protein LT85_2385 [Collimonas arenae]|uniref:Uncharacterized protein n=1 Tax=Collimonas arenae TaxID=279058 RepID=A0A0A1F9X1_9BURK|nr:hypothetical protein LT85_2385 [Collimonas arenae]